MSRVSCDVGYVTLYNSDGVPVDSVSVTCTKCGHSAEAYGESDGSVKRCLATLNEECPSGENNFYVVNH